MSAKLATPDSRPYRIATVFGTRPEIIKLAPVLRQIDLYPGEFESVAISSDQHTTLLAPFVESFQVKIDHRLECMVPGQSLNQLAAKVIDACSSVYELVKPDLVLVQGDTTTALGATLAAFYRRIPVGHVEAGLRTHDALSPYPEEMNRRLITRMASIHFAATAKNRLNLLNDGVEPDSIAVTGNPVVDALQHIGTTVSPTEKIAQLLARYQQRRIIAVTTHRRENFGATMTSQLETLRHFAKQNADVVVIFPVHPNPAVKQATEAVFAGSENVELIEPLDYPDFIALLKQAWLIVSDSGGIQEEAPSLGKRLIVLRESTERPECIDAGVAVLAGDAESLKHYLAAANSGRWAPFTPEENPFGAGDAAPRIVAAIRQWQRVRTATVARASV